jgi:hypothetical protein
MAVLREFLVTLVKNAYSFLSWHSTAYHAERHYMRGPGPACERKKASST